MKDVKEKIARSVQAFSDGNLTERALALFSTLGYSTDRQAPLSGPTFKTFNDTYVFGDSRFKEEKALVKDWKYVDLLFQLSDAEINKQTSLFDSRKVIISSDSAIAIHSYLFFVIELAGTAYTRTALSNITREINKLFPMPVMVLFKHKKALTLAVINRRLHKRDESKDVLLKVTLIKDINIANPHRAHIEILFDLTFDEVLKKHKFTNFVDLHKAWEKTLDTKELNKRFFQELANWYFWATDHVSFPDDVEKDTSVRNATNLIRLITRIIFIWFIKEKGLVPDTLFDRKELGSLIKSFSKDKTSDNYYKAILQNLFFGTLNQKMSERGFAREGSFAENRSNYGVKNLFRYLDLFSID
jgi:adenine-specific DNA-methyltransferase